MAERTVEYMPVDQIQPALRNAKAHHAESIGASIGRWGLIDVIALDERTGRIVSGHGRHEELLRAFQAGETPPDGVTVADGQWLVPVVRGWASADDDEAHAAGIALNRTGELGGWVLGDLVGELTRLGELNADLLAVTGFGGPDDLQSLLDQLAASDPQPEPARLSDPDDVPEPPKMPVTKRGDLWLLGDHRLLCGDCRDSDDVRRLVGDRKVNVAFTSPRMQTVGSTTRRASSDPFRRRITWSGSRQSQRMSPRCWLRTAHGL